MDWKTILQSIFFAHFLLLQWNFFLIKKSERFHESCYMHATYLKKRRKKYESILVCMQLRKRQRTCIDRTFSLDVEHIISVNDALYVVTALHTEPLRLTMVKGHHNWICAAYPHFVCCYRSEMLAQCAQLLLTSAWSFVAPLLLLFFSVILFCWKKYLKSTENLFSSFFCW